MKSCLCSCWVESVTNASRLPPAVTHLIFVCITDIHFLRLPLALPFLQFLPKLFQILPLVGRSVLVGIIQHRPAGEYLVRSDSHTK